MDIGFNVFERSFFETELRGEIYVLVRITLVFSKYVAKFYHADTQPDSDAFSLFTP